MVSWIFELGMYSMFHHLKTLSQVSLATIHEIKRCSSVSISSSQIGQRVEFKSMSLLSRLDLVGNLACEALQEKTLILIGSALFHLKGWATEVWEMLVICFRMPLTVNNLVCITIMNNSSWVKIPIQLRHYLKIKIYN